MVDTAVIIVNYRSYDELTNALTALQPETRTGRTEIVVVDQEGDSARAAAVKSQSANITLIENPRNDGFAAGVNRGARETTGRYLPPAESGHDRPARAD